MHHVMASAPSPRAQSGFTRPGAAARYDYARRRAALRASWFPGSAAALAAEEARGVVLRFVVGRAAGAGQEAALAAEERAHGDFLRLDLQARRRGPPRRTRQDRACTPRRAGSFYRRFPQCVCSSHGAHGIPTRCEGGQC